MSCQPPKPYSREDLEKDKFATNSDNQTVVRTCDGDAQDILSDILVQLQDMNDSDSDTGSTDHLSGTVGTIAVAVPAVPGGVITEILIEVPAGQAPTNKLYVSFDGGIKFKTMDRGTGFTWSPKGGKTQIHLKGNVAAVAYDIVMNRKAP